MSLLLTCEHAVNTIPDQFRYLFDEAEGELNSHSGIDFGALKLASSLSASLHIPLFSGEVSRLLIEMNRSRGNEQLFSKFTSVLSEAEKENLISTYYTPYRNR